ncbi:uncharacterized protein LOC109837367 isoform X2 [Asparagus officinalis]|uniref:uncharacterized protein LOC109837367 isoform X2 n=1 Tax=Asparagus officinalis TaxID=4686 RepID=UPI00098DF197|nr:uncharacterized protein LOC109837367 isoform X2 [Asparagus officinalis]
MAASLDLPNFEPCDHLEYLMMIKEANRAHEGICKIRAIALPPSPRTDGYSELIGDLFEDVLGSLTSLLSKLKTSSRAEWYSHMKRKRLDSWNILTTIPHYDGYEWRKYGQKKIRSSKFPRVKGERSGQIRPWQRT